jgi:hypothetical protein
MPHKPEILREHAAQCRALAERADTELSSLFLDLAKQWEELARIAEELKANHRVLNTD